MTEPACPAHARRWLAITFAAYVGLFAVLLHVNWRDAPFALAAGSAAMFVALIFLLHRAESAIAHIGLVIVGGGLLLQIVAVTTGPTTSDDVYRYIWDGKVQLAGTDPYAYAPQATQLRHLRDDSLFGPRSGCTYPIPDGSCTVINRPKVNTVYPPVAEGAFDAVRLVSAGGDGGTRAFQVAAAAGTVAISIMLLAWARAARRRLWAVAMWAWSPVVVIEFGNNAHIDWVAVLFSLGALRMCRARLPGWAGLLAGAAILTKIYPALLVPVLLRRRPLVVIGAGLGFGILAYIPHVLAVGSKVVGYLPGYLHEEGYESGSRLLLLGLVFPHPLDSVAAVLVLVIVAWWGARRCDPDRPEIAATILTGATFLVLTPSYGWYAALLIALIAWSGRFEWLPVAAAPTFVYLMRIGFNHSTIPSNIVYALAALLTIALAVRRGAMPVPSRWPAAVRRVAERV